MARTEKMSSRELGLVLAQQLLDVDDLHYGLWDADLPLTLGNVARAQQRYTQLLLGHVARLLEGIEAPAAKDSKGPYDHRPSYYYDFSDGHGIRGRQ